KQLAETESIKAQKMASKRGLRGDRITTLKNKPRRSQSLVVTIDDVGSKAMRTSWVAKKAMEPEKANLGVDGSKC
ncbi:hypothetical protein BVRB_023600, partial [Beta vulgaris subsp. vulgaris]